MFDDRTLREIRLRDAAKVILENIGEDATRDGLLETPKRVAKALVELTNGYGVDTAALLKTFENDSDAHDLVLVKDIPFYSLCEHHVLPFFGVAHVGYVPKDRIVGLSKFARLVDAFARRLQVQERLTNQIANAVDDAIKPTGVIVVIEGRHFCMEMRGVQKAGAATMTSAVRGCFKDQPASRAEALNLIRGGSS